MPSTLYAANLDLHEDDRPQIRPRILECETMLQFPRQRDDSVGIPFSSNGVEEFENELTQDLKTYGREKFRGGIFFVLGTGMTKEAETKAKFEKVLDRLNLKDVNAEIRVLSAPTRLIRDDSISLAQHIWQRIRYFNPSKSRDLQSPQWGEIKTGAWSIVAVESVNVYFVFKGMPLAQASLVVLTHAVLIGSLAVFSKSMLNWLMRKSSHSKTVNEYDLFMKQLMLSVPFVSNYAIFGRAGEILKYYRDWGIEKTLEAFPYEMAHFGTTQGLLLVIQTIYYAQAITKGFGGWVERQVGSTNTRDARELQKLLQILPLAADSAVLMWASSGLATTWFSLGTFDFNSGHAALIGLTVGMWAFFKRFPNALDPILRRYQNRRELKEMVDALPEPALAKVLPITAEPVAASENVPRARAN